ncbi:MAG TPA: hypothetical protein VGB53_05755 [Rubricoccaceae bacterium]
MTPLSTADPEMREAMLDAVREANGRRTIRPAKTVDAAAADVEAFLVVPEWAVGQAAADVAAETLREVHGLDAADVPHAWAIYTAGARRLGFAGAVPVPQLGMQAIA